MTATIVDCETTGIDEPQPVQIAWCGPLSFQWFVDPEMSPKMVVDSRYYRPTKPITLGALATHHILDEDLTDCTLWPGLWKLPEGTEYLIGHNVDFDWTALGMPQAKRICTLAMARKLWPDIDSHTLGALTYKCAPSREQARHLLQLRHDARTDVKLLGPILARMISEVNAGLEAVMKLASWEDVYQFSERARVPERLTFGKYGPDSAFAKENGGKGMRCADVRRIDPGYWNWLMDKCDQVRENPYLQRALRGEG